MTLWKALRLSRKCSASTGAKKIVKNLLLVSVFTMGIMSILASANLDSVKGKFIKPEVELQLSETYTSRVDKLNNTALEKELNQLDQTINKLETMIAERQQVIVGIESQKIDLIEKMDRDVIRDEKNPETIKYKALSTKRLEELERLIGYSIDIEEIMLKKEYVSSKLTGAVKK